MNLIKCFKDVSFFFRWYDLWIGVYVDVPNKTLYVIPIPMFGVKIKL
jgi:hypothetical protein